jgi:hypothetical protein
MSDDDGMVVCGNCMSKIGVYQHGPDNRIWLRLENGLLVRDMSAVCSCGAPWFWHSSDKALEDLVRKSIENRNKYN